MIQFKHGASLEFSDSVSFSPIEDPDFGPILDWIRFGKPMKIVLTRKESNPPVEDKLTISVLLLAGSHKVMYCNEIA